MATEIAEGSEVTNFGPEPGYDKVSAIAAPRKFGSVGHHSTVTLGIADDVVASVADLVVAEFRVPQLMRAYKVRTSNQAITGTSSVNIFNVTDAAAVTGTISLTTADEDETTTFSSTAQETWQEDDVIQVRATTAAASTIEGLIVWADVEVLDKSADLAVIGAA